MVVGPFTFFLFPGLFVCLLSACTSRQTIDVCLFVCLFVCLCVCWLIVVSFVMLLLILSPVFQEVTFLREFPITRNDEVSPDHL